MAQSEAEILTRVLAAIAAADVPEHLQSVAFEKVFDFVAEESRPGSAGSPAPNPAPTPSNSSVEEATALRRIAERLKVDEGTAAEVYDCTDETLSLVIPASRLDGTKSKATQQLAIVLAGGRQAAGFEDWTPHEAIREVATYFGKFDSANFSSHLKALDDVLQTRGAGAKREVKLRAPAWEKATELVRHFAATQ